MPKYLGGLSPLSVYCPTKSQNPQNSQKNLETMALGRFEIAVSPYFIVVSVILSALEKVLGQL